MMTPEEIAKQYETEKANRSPFEEDWRECARLALPRQYGGWQSLDSDPNGGRVARSQLLDTTALRAVPKYVAILNRLVTPGGYTWHGLEASNRELMRIRAVDLYFEDLTNALFKFRRDPKSHWMIDRQNKYTSLAVYGWGPTYIGTRKATKYDRGGPLYRSCAVRDVFLREDEDGNLMAVFRRMRPNARQAAKTFGRDNLPKIIRDEIDKSNPSETKRFEICHYIGPSDDFEEGALDRRGFPITGAYVMTEGAEKVFLAEPEGYWTMPYTAPGIYTSPENAYGYSPMQVVLSGVAGLQAMKRTVLRQGQKAADPVLLAADDGVLSGQVGLIPGHINYGALDQSGRERLKAMPVGDFQIAKELIEAERADIGDGFLLQLFQILTDHPEMKSAEVWDRISKEGMLVEMPMGILQSGDLAPTIDREIDILNRNGLAPEMPPELQEAAGEYSVIYTSPLAKMQSVESVSSYMRLQEAAAAVASQTGDSAPLRRFNNDTFIPEAADIMSIPGRWFHTDEEVQAAIKSDAQAKQVQQLADAAPALAGMAKAGAGAPNQLAAP